jgi:NAD(P)-dependent dehydrogenase (short-subunit alcohol dehydrogenase family)
VLLLAKESAKIAALHTDAQQLQAVIDDIQPHGGEVIALVADVSASGAVKAAVEQTIAQWGGRIRSLLTRASTATGPAGRTATR